MSVLRDMALMVEERAKGDFFWVLLEASDNQGDEELHYHRFSAAETPQASYSSALALGAAALRRLAKAGG